MARESKEKETEEKPTDFSWTGDPTPRRPLIWALMPTHRERELRTDREPWTLTRY